MADDAVQLFGVGEEGPIRLRLPQPPSSLHSLPPELPVDVYTVFRTFDGSKFLGLAAHLDRLDQSLALLGRDYRVDRGRLRLALHQACSGYRSGNRRVRIDVLRHPVEALGIPGRLLLTLAPFKPPPERCYEEGVRLRVAPRLQRARPRAKTADFIDARQAYPVSDHDAYEWLLLDDEHRILEGTSSNFYAVRDGTLWTAGEHVLEGITRAIVLQLAPEIGIPLRLEAVPLSGLPHFQEAFLSSSSRGLMAVVQIEEQVVGDGEPGLVTRQLMSAYERFVAHAVQPALYED
ncbi:MAG: aminotransferase class IV [Candidatus Promineifilaceae bacterium]|nr:aminotransferase class IV [Candidatus Promineifilaceae bacterium]